MDNTRLKLRHTFVQPLDLIPATVFYNRLADLVSKKHGTSLVPRPLFFFLCGVFLRPHTKRKKSSLGTRLAWYLLPSDTLLDALCHLIFFITFCCAGYSREQKIAAIRAPCCTAFGGEPNQLITIAFIHIRHYTICQKITWIVHTHLFDINFALHFILCSSADKRSLKLNIVHERCGEL